MHRSLLMTVRFHDGRYHGQDDGFDDAGGWPPSPARLFQALVAGVAKGARLDREDIAALRWLERLDPPRIAAPTVRRGRSVKLFVPNNDLDSKGGDPAKVDKIRVDKHWRYCFFDASQPALFVWDFDAEGAEPERICRIAEKLYQLGRGIDGAWASASVVSRSEAEQALSSHPGSVRTAAGPGPVAVPHKGFLDSLFERYQRNRNRFSVGQNDSGKSIQLFSQPPRASFRGVGYDTPPRRLHFELRAEQRFAPQPLKSVAALAKTLCRAAADRLRESLPDEAETFERLIVGRGAQAADIPQRIRLVPVPSIGAQHTDPSIRRVMVEVPPQCPLRVDDIAWAFAGLDPRPDTPGRARLVASDDAQMVARFARSGTVFESITPLALPISRGGGRDSRTGGERRSVESLAAGAVVQALRHAGVGRRPTDIRVQREPFQMRGVRAEQCAPGSRFSPCALWHVRLRFDEPVDGPLILGNGRFVGLGLMIPTDTTDDIFAFRLSAADWPHRDGRVLLQPLRRALMALDRDAAGNVSRLFSGHEADGRPDSGGHHAHVFLAADRGAVDGETRLIVAAPWAVDRSAKPQRGERRRFCEVVRGLHDLRAGAQGRFANLSAHPIASDDPLVGPASRWIGSTPYVATRYPKSDDLAGFLIADAMQECQRRGLPRPTGVQVRDLRPVRRGARPMASLMLEFAVAVHGPILLGRDSHGGGGLFHAEPAASS